MTRTNFLLLGTVFLSFLFFASPTSPQGNLPGDPWKFTAEDIGTTVPGDTIYDPADHPETFGTYTVTTHGGDIGGTADSFRFLYFEASGDFSISVCLLEISGLGEPSGPKAGVMVRQDNTPGSPVFIQSVERGEGGFCRWRPTQDADAPWAGAHEPLCPDLSCPTDPFWFRIRREGDTFYGEYSLNGETWDHQAAAEATIAMTDPVLVGIFLCSRFADTTTTAVLTDFRVDEMGPGTEAIAKVEPDDWVYGDEEVTLNGSLSALTTSYQWTYLKEPGGPDITIVNPTDAVATFTPPGTEVGYTLTFRLEVEGDTGTDSVDFPVYVRAVNAPKVAPSNLRVSPLDLGAGGLGCNVEWDPLVDAEGYQIGLKFDSTIQWIEVIQRTSYQSGGMLEGDTRTIVIRGRNKYGTSDEPAAIAEVTYTAMPNIALGASGYVFLGDTDPVGMNNGATDDSTSSVGLSPDITTYWGYTWDEVRFFDNIVYYTGNMTGSGGWFTDLAVEVTQDGTTWQDVPILDIYPGLDFSDQRQGKEAFTRYDIDIPAVRGTGIRISGMPGGMGLFTTVAELEVFGDQMRAADEIVAQGVDAVFPEGGTATLNGSLSFSLAGPITSYAWTGPAGITINNPTSAVASFDAPRVGADEVYVFSVTVTDDQSNTDTDDDVRITVRNLATAAVAGIDQRALEGTEVALDGSGSTTTTGDLTYLWTQTAGTEAGVTGATTRTVTFDAPVLWDFMEGLTFQLQVDDGAGGTPTDEVTISVYNFAGLIFPLGSGYFKELLHLGDTNIDRITLPMTAAGNDALETWGGRANQNPRPGEPYDFSDTGITTTVNPMVWTPEQTDNGWFMWDGRAGEALDEFQQYYHVYIISPSNRDVIYRTRNDDECRVFNNGALVLSRGVWDNNTEQLQTGLVSGGRGLSKGVNSITMMFEEGGGGNLIALRVTDMDGNEYTDLSYSVGPAYILKNAYGARKLPPVSYEPEVAVNVELSVRVNLVATPGTVTVLEQIPEGLSESDVNAPGATVAGGDIRWILTGDDVKTQTLTYSVTPPAGMTQALAFSGTVSFPGDSSEIFGGSVMYAVPTAPRYVELEMLQAAHVSWSAPATEGAASYRVERSVDGGPWEEILTTTTSTSYTDMTVEEGNNYSYRVYATNVVGAEGAASSPTEQASLPVMEIREAENFNYGQGQYPWTDAVTEAANEAPAADTLDDEFDYYHPNTGGPDPRVYRPLDNTAEGLGIHFGADVETKIGWVSPGSWWRYTFDVPEAGWIKLTFRIATHSSREEVTLAAYWDETLIGSVTFANNFVMTWEVLEDQIEAAAGEHTLRLQAVAGGTSDCFDFDAIAIGYNWTPPRRETIWEDDFDSYTANSEVFDAAVGGWTKQTAGYPDGAWQLWNTAVDPDIAGMVDGFMMSNSDMSGEDAPLDEQLISPQIDTSDYTKLRLNFNWNYQNYLIDPDDPQIAEVDLRVFDAATGWGDWINLLHLDLDSVPIDLDPAILSGTDVHDLSVYDGKILQIRFHYYDAEWDYWFAVDSIRVSGIQPEIRAGIMGLSLVGDQLTLDWEPHGSYYIEHTSDLTGTWADIAGPITGTTAVVTIPAGAEGYYRLRAAE